MYGRLTQLNFKHLPHSSARHQGRCVTAENVPLAKFLRPGNQTFCLTQVVLHKQFNQYIELLCIYNESQVRNDTNQGMLSVTNSE